MTELGESDVLVNAVGELFEGPCWDERTQRLVWVDILAGRVQAIDPATRATQSWEVGMPVGAVAPREAGGWVAAVEHGFAVFDDDWSMLGPVIGAPGQRPGTRFNDGGCDPAGRFWAGTLGYDGRDGAGALFCLGTDHRAALVIGEVTISNGLDWSLDSRTMYYVDSGRGTVDCMDFDAATGRPSGRRTLVCLPPEDGVPDGLTVDAEGYLWVAVWGGGCIRRYTRSGELERTVGLPVSQVSSMCFGGPRYQDLFITTAYEGLDRQTRDDQPLAGAVFLHRPGVTGRPARMFSGTGKPAPCTTTGEGQR